MNSKKKILCIIGTRPEAIKMAPLVLKLRQEKWAEVKVIATAQHRELLDQVFGLFKIVPEIDLNVMEPNQALSRLTSRLLLGLDEILQAENPDAVLAQGDTTTVFCSALACFYRRIPFGHVEAGLRTWNFSDPFPEEMNRVMASRLSRWHFAPTTGARENLLLERTPEDRIFVTGNTVIDALLQIAHQDLPFDLQLDPGQKLVLVTSHRRENFGQPLRNICRAILKIIDQNPAVRVLFPVHPNPNVRNLVQSILGGHSRIHLSSPLDYGEFVAAMKKSYVILTDSGGVQEEAPALGKPVLVLRNETERPEAVQEGVVRIVGFDEEKIVGETNKLLTDQRAYRLMAKGISPYGDGKACQRIVNVLRREWFPSESAIRLPEFESVRRENGKTGHIL